MPSSVGWESRIKERAKRKQAGGLGQGQPLDLSLLCMSARSQKGPRMDRPTAAQKIGSGQAAAGSRRLCCGHLYPLFSCKRVPREQLSCQRAWPGLSSSMPVRSNYQCWGKGEDGATDIQGLLWLPETASRRQSETEDQREDRLKEASLGRLQYRQRCSWRGLVSL